MNTISYWEQQGFGTADWVVVGAGLVGLQSASRIKETYPKARVMVLDEHAMGNAASLRNAGFACFGSAGEMLDEIARNSEQEAVGLYEKRYLGIQKLLGRYGAARIGFQASGGTEVFSNKEEAGAVIAQVGALNKALHWVHGTEAYLVCDMIPTKMNVVESGVFCPLEGGIQTHLLYRAVREEALGLGVEIYEGMGVVDWDEMADRVELRMRNGMKMSAGHLLICTNGFTRRLMPELAVAPARGQVFVTKAMDALPFEGIFHADKGYIYFRELGGDRVLIGGGRNLDFAGEETMEMGVTDQFRLYLKSYLETVVVPGREIEFEYEWSGVMGMNENRNPIIGWHSDRVCLAVRMGGMGVALSSWVADEVIRVVRGDVGI
jgi:glycine/D-amino acid oxidase-like deaminating enzyme